MKKVEFKTNDGITLEIVFLETSYKYSISDKIIDPSILIEKVGNCMENIEIDDKNIIDWKINNSISNEFEELISFVKSIFESLNEAIKELENQKIDNN